jgi:hypothetical protein
MRGGWHLLYCNYCFRWHSPGSPTPRCGLSLRATRRRHPASRHAARRRCPRRRFGRGPGRMCGGCAPPGEGSSRRQCPFSWTFDSFAARSTLLHASATTPSMSANAGPPGLGASLPLAATRTAAAAVLMRSAPLTTAYATQPSSPTSAPAGLLCRRPGSCPR